ncbi:MAG: FAD-binding oxidoreductase [Rhodospirillaceae bacterium]|nr:MAG: FAD-binding oxidoreductase [Rhodospirillaceae bacterium]
MFEDCVSALQASLGAAVLSGDAVPERHYSDATGHAPCRPLAVIRPISTEQVSTAMRLCHAHRCPVIPQGGMTGLAGGAVPTSNSIALSLERLIGATKVDTAAGTLTAWAGMTLEATQHAAESAGLCYPVDLGARGSCQIGGNIATNAGGHAVVRHGMTRDQVLGLEVVLADGRVLNLMNSMIKNNAGYDLKQHFIGSEGTLGIITRAVLRLEPALGDTHTVLCAAVDYPGVVKLLRRLRGSGLSLEAFEVMWQDFYAMSCNWLAMAPPLDAGLPLYVLCELEGDESRLQGILELSMAEREISDAVVAGSKAQARQLWKIREATAEFPSRLAPINFDISLPIGIIGEFAAAICESLNERWPGCRSAFFGHIGDSNLHLTVDGNSLPVNDAAAHHAIESLVYDLVGKRGGSISAEHGIGLLKREFLRHSVTDESLTVMRAIKHALDPRGILNPGKIFTSEPITMSALA